MRDVPMCFFPQDLGYTIDNVLLKISRLDKPQERLWPGFSSTLRSRLDKVLSRLGLPTRSTSSKKGLTLASFRQGGAIYLISLTESAEIVRRRRRWISLKVMEIYLQEVASSTFLTDIDPEAKKKILLAMGQFPAVLRMSARLSEARFTWNFFVKQEPRGVAAAGQMGGMGVKKPNDGYTTDRA